MGLVSAIADALSSEEGRGNVVRYECRDCGTAFDRAANHMMRVRCPDCGSANLRATDGE
ncbi:hypothetical protein [Halorarum salinum]|uniref:Zinc ribbon domain-containing protein n=1 Tax=Halorarum salinum TaxID=2743089 RepID=A0A7D5LAX1_9EURY|nr:hypothetical protein [Halobaculum salinum]QLG62150.1 hypothetical protein HUG12_10565 [Halobaculum salinum]